jgi:hypothetical protein
LKGRLGVAVLLSFRLENHRSIRTEQELSLLPAYDKSKPAVAIVAVFGANASGKSNLVDGLRFMWQAVRTSYAGWEANAGVPRTPFRLDPQAGDQPSGYAVELQLNGTGYVYGFSVGDERVVDEWLWAYPRRRKRIIFERRGQQIEFGSTVAMPRSRADIVIGLTRPNALFLSAAVQAGQPDVIPVYDWFRTGLEFPETSRYLVDGRFTEAVRPGADGRQLVIDLLQAADPTIMDVEWDPATTTSADGMAPVVVGSSLSGLTIQPPSGITGRQPLARAGLRVPDRLLFRHGEHLAELSLTEQSSGTRHWMNLLGAVLYALDNGTVLCVDEIDSSLHPRLTARLIELFQDERTNRSGAQLIFTTHDATLLGTSFGREILARDQIWFVDKESTGQTSLFPLSDFHPRKEENTERRYLAGSYGAVPAVFSDTLVEQVLEAREGADATA